MATASPIDEGRGVTGFRMFDQGNSLQDWLPPVERLVALFRQTFGTTPKAWITALETLGQRSTGLQAEGGNVRGIKQGAKQGVLRCAI